METNNNNLAHINHVLRVERRFYEQEQLNAELEYSRPMNHARCKSPTVCLRDLKRFILNIFPVIGWLSQYSVKNDLLADVISGCTVAVMHIPQGLGYAMLANVPPILGIYTAFFPVLVYFVLGTSRHNSMGTFAVVSIMVGKSVSHLANVDIIGTSFNATSGDDTMTVSAHTMYTPVQVASTLAFLVGIIQLAMYMFRMGIISSLLSEALVSGFTTGAAIHVLTSQVKDLLGINIKSSQGNFKLILTYVEVFKAIGESAFNSTTIIISTITIFIVVINNDYVKPALAKKCSIPMPIELMCVIGGTLISMALQLAPTYGVTPIGDIPTGFPAIQLPMFELLGELFVDAFTVAMVSYTVSVSMALIFAQKLNYEVDFNQELLAMGSGNVVGSVFGCLPFAASLSRSNIQQSVGGRTQVASLVSCCILAVVLLWIGPFFELLPRSVLAAIIVVSLKGMLMQVTQFVDCWRLSYLDAFVWLVTFLTVVIVAIDIGLAVGVVLSLACIFIRGMKPYTCLLGHVPNTDLYLDVNRYKSALEIPLIKIFHYCGSLNFASRNSFKTDLCELIKLNLPKETKHLAKTITNPDHKKYEPLPFKCVIIDFTALSYIDPSGCTALKQFVREINKIGLFVFIAGVSCPAYELMRKCDLKETPNGTLKFYPTVHDAVHQALEVTTPISVIIETPSAIARD